MFFMYSGAHIFREHRHIFIAQSVTEKINPAFADCGQLVRLQMLIESLYLS